MTDVLDYITIYVSELVMVPTGGLSRGIHDTLYSVTALVDLSLELPTAKEIYNVYKNNNAHFSVEVIKVAITFTAFGNKQLSQNGNNFPFYVNTSINKDYEHIQKIGRKTSVYRRRR
jgi:hypothetical protein